MGVDEYSHLQYVGRQHRRVQRSDNHLPSARHVEQHSGGEGARRQRAATVIVAAQDHGRAQGQTRHTGRLCMDFAEHRTGGQRLAQQPAIDAGDRQEFLRPLPPALIEQERRGSHAVVGGVSATEHEIDEVFDQQPLLGPIENGRFVLPHPHQAQGRIEDPDLVPAQGKLPLRAHVFQPPAVLRFGPRAVPTDEGVEPRAILGDRQAVHAHPRHCHALNLPRIGQLPDQVLKALGHVAPQSLRFPDGPLGMVGVGVHADVRPAGLRRRISLQVVCDGFEVRRAEVDSNEVRHGAAL